MKIKANITDVVHQGEEKFSDIIIIGKTKQCGKLSISYLILWIQAFDLRKKTRQHKSEKNDEVRDCAVLYIQYSTVHAILHRTYNTVLYIQYCTVQCSIVQREQKSEEIWEHLPSNSLSNNFILTVYHNQNIDENEIGQHLDCISTCCVGS